jgi:SAM-dependent methyltransferase
LETGMSEDFTGPYWQAFFELHKDLPREGPGEPADVAWAGALAKVTPDARICDAACGPGADIPALRTLVPEGHITALDLCERFVETARTRVGDDPAVTLHNGDMAQIKGPFDFIWCAGAVYFLGVQKALETWRSALAPGGCVAFSQLCWFTDAPSEAARAGWAAYADMTDEAGVLAAIKAAGFEALGTRRLSDAAWEGYLTPIDHRIAVLAEDDRPDMQSVLDEARAEAALWRAHRAEFGYLLCVVRPR